MLEVWLASIGAAIAGAAKGYAGSRNSAKPGQLFLSMSVLSLVSINEAVRFQRRRVQTRSHIPGASAHLMDDTIIESSPTYLVDNSPLFLGIYAGVYTVVGVAALMLTRRSKSFKNMLARTNV